MRWKRIMIKKIWKKLYLLLVQHYMYWNNWNPFKLINTFFSRDLTSAFVFFHKNLIKTNLGWSIWWDCIRYKILKTNLGQEVEEIGLMIRHLRLKISSESIKLNYLFWVFPSYTLYQNNFIFELSNYNLEIITQ